MLSARLRALEAEASSRQRRRLVATPSGGVRPRRLGHASSFRDQRHREVGSKLKEDAAHREMAMARRAAARAHWRRRDDAAEPLSRASWTTPMRRPSLPHSLGDPHWHVFLDSALQGQANGRWPHRAAAVHSRSRARTASSSAATPDRGRSVCGPCAPRGSSAMLLHPRRWPAPIPGRRGRIASATSLSQHLGRLPLARADDMRFPDLALGFHDVIISFDHHEHGAPRIALERPARNAGNEATRVPAERLREIMARSGRLARSLRRSCPTRYGRSDGRLAGALRVQAAVQRVIDYLLATATSSRRIFRSASARSCRTKSRRGISTDASAHSIRSAVRGVRRTSVRSRLPPPSPERFLRLANGRVETCPIKGTARRRVAEHAGHRGSRSSRSARSRAAAKDRAENVMIVATCCATVSRACAATSCPVGDARALRD